MVHYFKDELEIDPEDFESYLEEDAELIAQEDGIYHEWMMQGVSNMEYEDYIDSIMSRFISEFEENGCVDTGFHNFQKVIVGELLANVANY